MANRRLTSPVVDEFKGWFSNLFNWKAHLPSSTSGVLYSPDDVAKTRETVGRLLEGLGIVVTGSGFTSSRDNKVGIEGGKGIGEGVLKCRLDEGVADVLTGLDFKPVRFRVEFSAAPGGDLLSPDPNGLVTPRLFASPNPGAISRGHASTLLMNKSSRGSPNPNAGSMPGMMAFPPGCASAIVMVQEKGSVTTFKMVWRRLREVYEDVEDGSTHGGAAGYLSPAMGSTPVPAVPYQQRFAI
jgi:hypothetical protein